MLDEILTLARQIKADGDLAQIKRIAGDIVRADADRWITVNSGHGEGGGTPALIGQDGTVKGGMGGKFNGMNIKDANSESLKARNEKRQQGAAKHAKGLAKQEGRTTTPQSKQSDLGHDIKKLGGINLSHAKDILGDKPTGAAKFAFSKQGEGIDDLATQLKDKGYPIDTDTVDGGIQQLKDLIRQHFGGDKVTNTEGEEDRARHALETEHRDKLWEQAEKKGIKVTKSMDATAINDAIEYHDAREEAESLGIKVTDNMPVKAIYGRIEMEMDLRSKEAEEQYAEKERKKAEKQSAKDKIQQEQKREQAYIAKQNEPVQEHRYAMVNRPIGIGTIPKEGLIRGENRPAEGEDHHEHARNGIAVFNRKLTDAETKQYEMAHIAEGKELDSIADTVTESMKEYAAEYLEQAKEDPSYFKSAVRDHMRETAKGHLPSVGNAEKFENMVRERLESAVSTKDDFSLKGQTNADINEQLAKDKEAESQRQAEIKQAYTDKLARDAADVKARTKAMTGNADNFVFGEDSRAASKPMGSLFADSAPKRRITGTVTPL